MKAVLRAIKAMRVCPDKKAAQQLEEARLALLDAEAHAEYYDAMAGMLRDRIYRLERIAAAKLKRQGED